MIPDNLTYDPVELAALYTAGALTPEEVASFEARLDAGDEVLATEVSSYDEVIYSLLGNVEEVAPPPTSMSGVLEQVAGLKRHEPGLKPTVPNYRGEGEIFIRRAQLGDWREYGVPGIQLRVLFRDYERNLQTSLIRMAAGVELPGHPHPGVEECYVVEGDVSSIGTSFSAGDYMRFPAGTTHDSSRTVDGCLLLITTEIAS
jgi:anti-sigma factor ChrR (cupin superfamily)